MIRQFVTARVLRHRINVNKNVLELRIKLQHQYEVAISTCNRESDISIIGSAIYNEAKLCMDYKRSV